jgi:hypothetical protein
MAKISNMPLDEVVSEGDLLLGSNSVDKSTKNFSVAALSDHIIGTGGNRVFPVKSKVGFRTQEPENPEIGDRYINTQDNGAGLIINGVVQPTSDSNITGTTVNRDYIYVWEETGWRQIAPSVGMTVFVIDESLSRIYFGAGTDDPTVGSWNALDLYSMTDQFGNVYFNGGIVNTGSSGGYFGQAGSVIQGGEFRKVGADPANTELLGAAGATVAAGTGITIANNTISADQGSSVTRVSGGDGLTGSVTSSGELSVKYGDSSNYASYITESPNGSFVPGVFTVFAASNPGGAGWVTMADMPFTNNAGTVTDISIDNTTGLTFTGTETNGVHAFATSGTLNIANGGTGMSSYSEGDLIYATSSGLATISIGSTGQFLTCKGPTSTPEWTDGEDLFNKQIEVTGNTTIGSTYNNHTIFINSANSVTITIGTGVLSIDGFDCSFYNLGAGEVSFSSQVGVALGTPDGTKLATDKVAMITRVLSTSNVKLKGELTT